VLAGGSKNVVDTNDLNLVADVEIPSCFCVRDSNFCRAVSSRATCQLYSVMCDVSLSPTVCGQPDAPSWTELLKGVREMEWNGR
jgi:hypothetical protein